MKIETTELAQPSDFRRKSTLGLAWAALILLTPFALNNFFQGRPLLGLGGLLVEALLFCNYWGSRKGKLYDGLTLFGLVPALLFFLSLAMLRQGMIGVMWCYPTLIAFYILLPERKAWLANIALLVVTIPQAWLIIEHDLVLRMAATFLITSIFSAVFIRAISEQQEKLQRLATTDPLTGLNNRMTLAATLDQAISLNNRNGVPMTLLIMDLDNFKKVNDELGHDAGDKVLREIGMLLQQRFRKADKVFRVGGEEFLVLLSGTDGVSGLQVAEELRKLVESRQFLPGRRITVSIGMAPIRPDESRADWQSRADQLLYRAKDEGRNRVVGAEDSKAAESTVPARVPSAEALKLPDPVI